MMQFDWTTFILEIINFLVLLWLLQRFLYLPVLSMLDSRQQRLRDEMNSAGRLRIEAENLRQQYQQQLAEWEQQQEINRHQLEQELAQLRHDEMANLKQSLADEEAKWQIRNQAAKTAREAAMLREANITAYKQAAAMLQRLASTDLTSAITRIFLEDLQQLTESEQKALYKAAMSKNHPGIEITSAHPLPENLRLELGQSLLAMTNPQLDIHFINNSELIAGIRIVVGECQLHANLADELSFFRQQAIPN